MTSQDIDNLTDLITSYTISANATQRSQIRHRLSILAQWFGSLSGAQSALNGKTVLEIGCGQGDMTATLAYVAAGLSAQQDEQTPVERAGTAKIIAVDPATLDYGSPYTLGQAQAHLSSSALGSSIEWVQQEPIAYLDSLATAESLQVDYVVLAHCLFYFSSEDYLGQLLGKLEGLGRQNPNVEILVAEWGMRCSDEKAVPHLLAVEVQAERPLPEGNIQTVLSPEKISKQAQKTQWRLKQTGWIATPETEDGQWEIYAARDVAKMPDLHQAVRGNLYKMEELLASQSGKVKCMDVWTAVFSLQT